MTMVSTGPISIGGSATSGGLNQSINIELGRAATATSSLNESALRTLAGVPSGAISLSNFYGKSNAFAFTISTPQTNADLRTLAIAAGWNQSTLLNATIAPGVQITSTSTGTPALTVSGSYPSGVTLTNNGLITGRGGNGGPGGQTLGPAPTGFGAGTGLSVSSAISITNNGTVAGGGGGGGGGGLGAGPRTERGSGGGGGGGIGISSGGPGGVFAPNPSGTPGTAGTATTAGPGGAGANTSNTTGGTGGTGGGYGSAGAAGALAPRGNAARYPGGAGGAAGPATSGNANITWVVTGNRFGPLN